MLSDSPRVLILERDAETHEHISDVLASAGYATRTANTSQSALDMLDDWHPSVLVVDLRVPNREGRRFCASLAKHAPDTSPPVVLLGEMANMMKPAPIVPFGMVPTPIDEMLLTAAVGRAAEQQTDGAKQYASAP